jgi:cysteinyl-tRNA synthetase
LEEIERGLQTFYRAFERFHELTGARFDQLEAPSRRAELDTGSSEVLREIGEHRERFLEAMDDDFNTGGALGELYDIVRALNRAGAALSPTSSPEALAEYRSGMVVLKELTQILGIFCRPPVRPEAGADGLTGPLMELLIELRARLRKEKNYALADEVRNRLTALGVVLEDRPDGTRWRVEPRR